MCGINAIISKIDGFNFHDNINKMNDQIVHRGPDSEGCFVYNNLGLGHRRLSIIDLSSDGAQPMTIHDGYVIVYNGEIYNYIELKNELIGYGYNFKTKTDTEVVIVSYMHWGEDCSKHFNGMWAFVILDKSANKLFCSRDHFGIKPFYYLLNQTGIFISSEIKPLLNYLQVIKANKKAVLNYLVLDISDEGDHTFFDDVKKLLPGTNLCINLESCQLNFSTYYKPGDLKSSYQESKSKSRYKEVIEILESSIKLRLRSDVKLGTCLSGGLDSSLITALASRENQKTRNIPLLAYTASSSDAQNDESHFAKEVVDEFGCDWIVSKPTESDFIESLDEIIKVQEEPFRSPSIVMQHKIMSESKKLGCIVLLDGQGGDELFLGYERYYIPYLRCLGLLNRVIEFVNIIKFSKLSTSKLWALYIYISNSLIRKKVLSSRVNFIKKSHLKDVSWEYLKELSSANINIIQELEINKFTLPALLRYEDKNSMHCSIETRLPFLDFRLVECALALKIEHKINKGWTKYILREIADDILPPNIAWRRRKYGFEFPGDWLKDESFFLSEIKKSKMINELCEGELSLINDKNLVWRMYNLSRWESIFNVLLF